MVLIGKFEVGFSELNRKDTDNLQLLLSVLPVLLLRSMGSKAHKLSSFEGLVALRHVGC